MKIDVLADIETLLHHDEEVTLPGIGSLSTRQNDFYIDRREGKILPASKQVHDVAISDGENNDRLVRFIAHKYGISLEEARQKIEDFAYEHRNTLRNEGLKLPSVGRLFADENGNIHFEPTDYHNYNIEYFGLPPLKNFHPLSLPKGDLAPREEVRPAKPTSYVQIIQQSRPLQLMIPIILLLIISIPLSQRYFNNSGSSTGSDATIIPPTEEIITRNTNTGAKPLPVSNESEPIVNDDSQQGKVEEPEEIPTPIVKSGETHLIVLGVFGSKSNAERLQVDVFQKGYDADLTEKSTGRFQVGIILKCKKQEVAEKLKGIKQDYPSAWWKR